MDAFQVVKHLLAIDNEIPNVRKLRHRFELDWLVQVVDERGARLSRATVDDHRADAADLFETVHAPHRRRGLVARLVDRILLNLHQARNDVEIGSIRNFKLFPVLRRVGVSAPPNVNLN